MASECRPTSFFSSSLPSSISKAKSPPPPPLPLSLRTLRRRRVPGVRIGSQNGSRSGNRSTRGNGSPLTAPWSSLALNFPRIHPPPARLQRACFVVGAQDDDFEYGEDGLDFDLDKDDDELDEDNVEDYELGEEYGVGGLHDPGLAAYGGLAFPESSTFVSTEGKRAEDVAPYRINEDEFHKLSLLTCDFFIRKVPDDDDDVYDFREMYVTPPDTDIYSIPKVEGKMPKKPIRLTNSSYEGIHVTEPPPSGPRFPLCKTEFEVTKIFLMKHFKNRRADHWDFALDFEEIYVIDAKTKSISRAKVTVCVPGGRYRDRSEEILTVTEGGSSFRVIHKDKRRTPDDIVQSRDWIRTKEKMDNHLKGFRDYETSNWF